jgi:acyl-CoA synthetase (AMP-forming)/AMP-acid ligase II
MKSYAKGVDLTDLPADNVGITEAVFSRFSGDNDRIAYVDLPEGREMRYGELREKVVRLAHGLAAAGWTSGQVACIHCYNMPEFVIAYYAALAIGMVVTPANSLYSYYELSHQLKDSEAELIFTPADSEYVEKCVKASQDTSVKAIYTLSAEKEQVDVETGSIILTHYLDVMSQQADLSLPPLEVDSRTCRALIPYSSGTTGLSKGVALTHFALMCQIAQIRADLETVEGEILFGVPPLYHIYGCIVSSMLILSENMGMLLQRRFDFVNMLQNIAKYKVSRLTLVPPIVIALAKHPIVDSFDLSSVTDITCAAASMAPEQIDIALSKLNNPKTASFLQGYGMTEIGGAATATTRTTPLDLVKAGSVGLPLPGCDIKVVDVASYEVVEAGVQGEICIRSPANMLGYINREQETADTLMADGWVRTGDLGHMNEEGYLWITDRLKELIKYKAFQVPPAEIEALLLTHPAVEDAGVIGVPDQEAGELPRAYIKLKPNAIVTEDELRQFTKERLAPFKQLKGGVEFVTEIPKSAAGKILRRVLRERLQSAK